MRSAICLLLVAGFIFIPSLGVSFASGINGAVQEYRLPNGMLWLLVKRAYAPTFSAAIAVKAGGIDEKKGTSGIAHMFEHMAFKGSAKYGTKNYAEEKPLLEELFMVGDLLTEERKKEKRDQELEANLEKKITELNKEIKKYQIRDEISQIIEENGGVDLNASTSKDLTLYYVSLPKDRFGLFLNIFTQMIFRPVFRDFYTERDVVASERRIRIDNNPYGLTFENLLSTAYEDGPFSWSIIGLPDDISNLTIKEARKYFSTYYKPNNMIGVVVGDINIDEVKGLLLQHFGTISKGRLPPTPAKSKELKGTRRDIVSFGNPAVVMAFHKPVPPDKDSYAFDVLTYLLCDGKDSRLEKKLIYDDKLASAIFCDANYPDMRDDNLFLIYAEPAGGSSLAKLQKSIEDELKRVEGGSISQEEIQKIRNQMQLAYYSSLQKNSDFAKMLARAQITFDDWRIGMDYPKKIALVGEKELKELFSKYLKREDLVVIHRKQKGVSK